MSDDKTEEKKGPRPSEKRAAAMREKPATAIHVWELKFGRQGGVDVPRKAGASGLRSETFANKPGYDIWFMPALRQFQIVYIAGHDRDAEDTIMFVPEHYVQTWTPMSEKPEQPK